MWFFYLVLACVLPVQFASAHENMPSFEVRSDGYLVDIGYDSATETISAAVPVRFNIALYDDTGVMPTTFTRVWLEIREGGAQHALAQDTIFSGYLANEKNSPASFTTDFPVAGEYTIRVLFENAGTQLVDVSMPISIDGRVRTNRMDDGAIDHFVVFGILAAGALGSVIGAGAMVAYYTSRDYAKKNS